MVVVGAHDLDREDDDADDVVESAASAGSPESASPNRSGSDSATALPTFTLGLKADSASDTATDKATDEAAEAPQEGKDD